MKDLRYYQVLKPNIVVDQLIYGCYGSTGNIDCMALGKPVISSINKSKKLILKTIMSLMIYQ